MPYSETRFNEIKTKIETYLAKLGFTNDKVQTIPASGLFGDNLTSNKDENEKQNMPWYKGKNLLEAISSL